MTVKKDNTNKCFSCKKVISNLDYINDLPDTTPIVDNIPFIKIGI